MLSMIPLEYRKDLQLFGSNGYYRYFERLKIMASEAKKLKRKLRRKSKALWKKADRALKLNAESELKLSTKGSFKRTGYTARARGKSKPLNLPDPLKAK